MRCFLNRKTCTIKFNFFQIMTVYLTQEALLSLLQNQWFTQFYSKHINFYKYYRGRHHAKVLTLRYNINSSQFSEEAMIESVIRITMDQFPNERQIIGLIEYDLVLMQPNNNSFYIWRANSNVHRNVSNNETVIALTYDDLYLFIRNANNVSPADISVHFRTSNVIVQNIISIIYTFICI